MLSCIHEEGRSHGTVRRIHSEIHIDATPERVWGVLTDFDAFSVWNPFLVRLHGDLRVGGTLAVTLKAGDRKPVSFRPKVLMVERPREIRWVGHLGVRGVFDGEHSFRIEPQGERASIFLQEERFTGGLVPLFGSVLRDTEMSFQRMNRALKERVEAAKGGG